MKSNDIERCAQVLGMKPSEVLEVVPGVEGDLVRTHDNTWTLIRSDGGGMVFGVAGPDGPDDEATTAMLRGFRGDPDQTDAQPAPRRRGRGQA